MQEPLLLLPGMMCDARLFLPQVSTFSCSHPILVSPLVGENTIAGLAQRVLKHAPARFALAGLSMGGIVAMEMVRQAPERISRLALMDTNPLPDAPENAAVREAQVKKVLNGQLNSVMRDEMKPNYLYGGPRLTQILDLCMAMAETLGPRVFVDQSNAVQYRHDQSDVLRSVSVPSLVLCGAEDRLCPVATHERMCELMPHAQLIVVQKAGHLPTLEQPDATNEALRDWLNA
ncbi:MAG: alpha/beta hydrolase [Gammaproteobacteria bacterium]|nr:alpha/beta hydrolase [Gammaproteobacteria bacterium]